MAFRNDHEAALRRAAALEADLKAEQRAEADKDKRIAVLEHELGDAKAALVRVGVTAPVSTSSAMQTWTEVSQQLDQYLAQTQVAKRRADLTLAALPATVMSAVVTLAIFAGIWHNPIAMAAFAVLAAVTVCTTLIVLARRHKPAPYTPLACPTCKLEILGTADSVPIKLVRSLHRCPHCQSALCVD